MHNDFMIFREQIVNNSGRTLRYARFLFGFIIMLMSASCGGNIPSQLDLEREQQRIKKREKYIAQAQTTKRKKDKDEEITMLRENILNIQPRVLSSVFNVPPILSPLNNCLPTNIYAVDVRIDMYYDGSWHVPECILNWDKYISQHKNDSISAEILSLLIPEIYRCSQLSADDDVVDLSMLRECHTDSTTCVYYLFFDRGVPALPKQPDVEALPLPRPPEKPNFFGKTFTAEKFDELNCEYEVQLLQYELKKAKLVKKYRDALSMRTQRIADRYNLPIKGVQTSLDEGQPKNGDIRLLADVHYFDTNSVYLLYADYTTGRPEPLNFEKNGFKGLYIKKYATVRN